MLDDLKGDVICVTPETDIAYGEDWGRVTILCGNKADMIHDMGCLTTYDNIYMLKCHDESGVVKPFCCWRIEFLTFGTFCKMIIEDINRKLINGRPETDKP